MQATVMIAILIGVLAVALVRQGGISISDISVRGNRAWTRDGERCVILYWLLTQ